MLKQNLVYALSEGSNKSPNQVSVDKTNQLLITNFKGNCHITITNLNEPERYEVKRIQLNKCRLDSCEDEKFSVMEDQVFFSPDGVSIAAESLAAVKAGLEEKGICF